MSRWLLLVCLSSALYAQTNYVPKKTLDDVTAKYGKFAKKRVNAMTDMMSKAELASEDKKLKLVNDFFNRVMYMTDMRNWKVKDYWATRMEFMGKDKGDCEDYAIAKYFTLIQLGIAPKKLFLSYVKLVKLRQAHMVLTYFKTPKSIPLVLDNMNFKIFPANKRRDLKPVFSFNAESLYKAKQAGLGKMVPSGNKKNKKWLDLMDNIKRDKI
jgi:predicted transglutaminase-like cysteine proteinase